MHVMSYNIYRQHKWRRKTHEQRRWSPYADQWLQLSLAWQWSFHLG